MELVILALNLVTLAMQGTRFLLNQSTKRQLELN